MATPKVLLLPPTGQCKTLCALHILMQPKNLVHFFKCMDSSCSFTSDDDDLFLVHLSAHREQALLCVYCGLLATSGPRLIKHMVTAHGSRKAQCSLCLYRACSKTHLALHTAIAHEGSVLPWYLCKNIAPPVVQPLSLGDVSAALYRCVNGPKIARVQTCRFFCLTAKAFREHLQENHSGHKLYTCHLCKRRNKSPATLIKHYAHSHGFLRAQCLHCDFVHTSEWKVFKHVMEEHADKPFRLLLRSGRAPVAWVMLKGLSASLLSKFVVTERPNMWEALENAVQVGLTPDSSSEAGICQESGLGNGRPPSGGMSVCNSMKGLLAYPLPTDLDQHTLEECSTEGGLSNFCNKGEDLRELPSEDEILANLLCSIPEIQSLPSERMCKLHEDNSQEPESLHQGFQVSSVTHGAHTEKMQEQGRRNSFLQPHNQAIAGGMSEYNRMKGLLALPLPTESEQHDLKEHLMEGMLSGYCSTGEDLRELPSKNEMPANLQRSTPEVQSLPSEKVCKLHEVNSQELEPLHQGFHVSSVILVPRTEEVQEQGRGDSPLQPHNQPVATNAVTNVGDTTVESAMSSAGVGIISAGELAIDNSCVAPYVCVLCHKHLEKVAYFERMSVRHGKMFLCNHCATQCLAGPSSIRLSQTELRPALETLANKKFSGEAVISISDSDSSDTAVCEVISDVEEEVTATKDQRSKWSSARQTPQRDPSEKSRRNSLNAHDSSNCLPSNFGAKSSGIAPGRPPVPEIIDQRPTGQLALKYTDCCPNGSLETCPPTDIVVQRRLPDAHSAPKFERTEGLSGPLCIRRRKREHQLAASAITDQKPVVWLALKNTNCCSKGSLQACPPTDRVVQRRLLCAHSALKFERTGLSGPLCIKRRKRKHQLAAPTTTDQKPVVQLNLKNTNCCPKGSLQTCPPSERVVQRGPPNAHSALEFERSEDLPVPLCIRRRQRKHQLAAPEMIDQKPVVQLALKNTDCCPKGSFQTCPPTDGEVQRRLPNAHSAPEFERTEDLQRRLCIQRRKRKHQLAPKTLASNQRCVARKSLSGNGHFVRPWKPCSKRSSCETAITIGDPEDNTVAALREVLVLDSDPEDEVTATTCNGFSYYGLKSRPLNNSKLLVCDSNLRIPYVAFVSARKFQPRLVVPKFGIADFIGQHPCE
ncbi:uncharacterized protein LOC115331399 isoform X1 [Ixodes scapularis]|uniref:uncharacterized protein LOC115331399 isoform X1 n=1 Tax=Ixodes scapularis TaxID=6945 RepID=UPI001A9CBDB6|nr:uncharacterized protein LOC115331399 isoform X1 [Ixodes scapularis]XP_029849377.2 uncharacterized protein LOC115331399 isoform X1 [Ixodes scapularis]